MTTDPDISTARLRELRQQAGEEKLESAVLAELAEMDEQHRLYVFRPESRCRVCMSEANDVVNGLLANGLSYQKIVDVLDPINKALPVARRITYDSVWGHAKKHFPIERTAAAVYRHMVERRAEEYGIDFVRGTASALTPLAYLDVVMQKAFENLVDEGTTVSIEVGLRAAEKLHAMSQEDTDTANAADSMLLTQRVIEAVKSTVPESLWPAILAKIEGGQDKNDIVDADTVDIVEDVSLDPDDPDFDPEDDAGQVFDDDDD